MVHDCPSIVNAELDPFWHVESTTHVIKAADGTNAEVVLYALVKSMCQKRAYPCEVDP